MKPTPLGLSVWAFTCIAIGLGLAYLGGVGFAASFALHLAGFSGPATWAISSIGLIGSTYGAAVYLGGNN